MDVAKINIDEMMGLFDEMVEDCVWGRNGRAIPDNESFFVIGGKVCCYLRWGDEGVVRNPSVSDGKARSVFLYGLSTFSMDMHKEISMYHGVYLYDNASLGFMGSLRPVNGIPDNVKRNIARWLAYKAGNTYGEQ